MIPTHTASSVSPLQRKIAVGLLIASGIAIAALTLTPEPGVNMNSFWCLKCGGRPGVDVLLNILLFIPLGVGLGLYGLRLRQAALIAFACTFIIETAQFVIPGRDASARDILMNFVGGLIGYHVGKYWRTVLQPGRAAARNIALAVTVAWVVTQVLTSWAMQVAPPRSPWWAQLLPERDEFRAYSKDKIVGLSLDTLHIQYPDQLDDDVTEPIRKKMQGGVPFRVSLTDVDTARPLAAIAIISAGPVRDVVWWAAGGRDAVFGITVRGTRIGLRTPLVRFERVIPASRSDTVELTGQYRYGWYQLQAREGSEYRHLDLRASPSWGWAFVLPFPLYAFGSEVIWLTALYLLGVWLILGYWYARSVESARVMIPITEMAVGVVLGLGIAPIVFAIPVANWAEWLAAIAGGSAGWLLGTINRNVD